MICRRFTNWTNRRDAGRQGAQDGARGARPAFALAAVLTAIAFLLSPVAPRAQGRLSLSSVARDANIETLMSLLVDGESVDSADAAPVIPVEASLELAVEITWQGDDTLIADVELEELKFINATLADPEAPNKLALSDGSIGVLENGRTRLRWKVALAPDGTGVASVGRVEAHLTFAGFEERPAYPVAISGIRWTYEGKPFPILPILGWIVGLAAIGAGGYFGGRFVIAKAKEISASAEPSPGFSSEDPTPYEQAHAELASCDMKAQAGDIEGFFAKFRPIVLNFVATTEGAGIKQLSAEEIAAHLEEVEYNPRIASVLVDCLKICERYSATGQEPSVETCSEMVREMRDAAVTCTKRPPRGIRNR